MRQLTYIYCACNKGNRVTGDVDNRSLVCQGRERDRCR
jgi:hypothetical protein